jgi:molybdate transport system substrate-binding protein
MKPAVLRFALLLLCLFAAGPAAADTVSAAVAANFSEAIQRLAPLFHRATGHTLQPSLGATGKFYAQIKNGAPFEVLLAADAETPRRLAAEGLALPDSRFAYAVGRLALWSPTPGVVDARGEVLKKGDYARIAIANPKLAPYGAAAVAAMKRLGVYDTVAPKLVQGENIAQAFQFVQTGNAQLGFVALAQVMALKESERGSWWTLPAGLHPPIRQDAVLLKAGADKPAARAFLEFLKGREARRVIESLGYATTPGDARPRTSL